MLISMSPTKATDLFLAAFNALDESEREEVFSELQKERLAALAEADGEDAKYFRSLKLVKEHLGETPTSTTYRQAWSELRDAGEEVENLSAVIGHFGSWRQAVEALGLANGSSVKAVKARFEKRRLGKVWRYTAETLEKVLRDCHAEIGHVPQLAEFIHWRNRKLEIARARGDDALHLPSDGPYRRRYGSWEKALLAFGYTPDEVAERLERQ
jgi:hypothetical protein